MPPHVDRREFIKTGTLAAGALAFGVPSLLRGQNLNSKLNIACVGIGGKGRSDTDACAGENIVALCDVDAASEAYETQTKKYPDAKFFKDFRQMLDQMDHQIDAVTVSTPDHMHAIVASAAMKRNKAVFVQKPLTQTVYEARYLRKMAHDRKLVTQMGNQGSAADGLRRGVETIQDEPPDLAAGDGSSRGRRSCSFHAGLGRLDRARSHASLCRQPRSREEEVWSLRAL
jgi:hypothetical protein